MDVGAIPRGCFETFMKRDRFAHISRNLHFSSNADPRAATDRAWKLRLNVLESTFQANCIPPPVMAFDEAMLPSRSTFNRMLAFMKDKPHKWGTKHFMLCSSQTAYCIRLLSAEAPSTPRGGETTYYCGACKLKAASEKARASRVFLSNKIKHTSQGETITCFNIWHDHWKDGTMIPNNHYGDRGPIRARKPGNSARSVVGQAAEESDSGSDPRHPQQRKRRRRDEH
ncbi:unnamed protein product [Phytophthora fragariaefolia]|uniref:Unnamed protein product n=1 Tax=Phytophthora fragariaefolia TaxID=1490495 RepID=A0A9W6Y0B0_9STRA|nr:unnamed protein product [Phytophthora fragariaefolia]